MNLPESPKSTKTYAAHVGEYVLNHEKVLGIGGFGKVVLGNHAIRGTPVAVKIIDRDFIKKHNLEEYVTAESKILGALHHPHVVRLIAVHDAPDAIYFVTELACKGELFDRIVHEKYFTEAVGRKYYQQIISAVHACHSRNICHRDLKAENLLLDDQDELKVCDFGLSTVVDVRAERPVMLHSIAGSTDYQCPEMLDGDSVGYDGRAADLWSSAVILSFMLSGFLPFSAETEQEIEKKVLSGHFRIAKHISKEAASFIARCFNLDPSKRPKMEDILDDEWFLTDIDESLFPQDTLSPSRQVSNASLNGSMGSPLASPLSRGRKQFPTACSSPSADVLLTIQRAFDSLDVAGTGVLPREAIRDVLIELNCGKPVSTEEVDAMMTALDLSCTGMVHRDDFAMAFAAHSLPNTTDLQKKFQLSRLIDVFHFQVEAELLTELRHTFGALDKASTGILDPQQHPDLVPLGFFSPSGNKPCTFDSFVRHWEASGRKSKLSQKLDVLHDLVTYEMASSYHKRGGFIVRGGRDKIQQAIISRLPDKGYEVSTPAPGLVHAARRDAVRGRVCIEVSVILLPATKGYTKVDATRLRGPTLSYHEVLQMLLEVLRPEKEEADEDFEVEGESMEI